MEFASDVASKAAPEIASVLASRPPAGGACVDAGEPAVLGAALATGGAAVSAGVSCWPAAASAGAALESLVDSAAEGTAIARRLPAAPLGASAGIPSAGRPALGG
jgi:hypothetical protein